MSNGKINKVNNHSRIPHLTTINGSTPSTDLYNSPSILSHLSLSLYTCPSGNHSMSVLPGQASWEANTQHMKAHERTFEVLYSHHALQGGTNTSNIHLPLLDF